MEHEPMPHPWYAQVKQRHDPDPDERVGNVEASRQPQQR
jgi:hypothetical protein